MQMLCYKCSYSWNYKGKNTEGEGYITCPGCYYKIRLDKALIGSPSQQKLLTNLPNKRKLLSELPNKLPTTTSFERVSLSDGFVCLVDKRIAKQFKEAPEEVEEVQEEQIIFQEEEPTIRILPPNFEIIRTIPYDPIKHLEHQRSFLW